MLLLNNGVTKKKKKSAHTVSVGLKNTHERKQEKTKKWEIEQSENEKRDSHEYVFGTILRRRLVNGNTRLKEKESTKMV